MNGQQILRCCKYQLFKDRKQITTVFIELLPFGKLLQISVIQRSKANHNNTMEEGNVSVVVANISYSKIESKSQLEWMSLPVPLRCCKYQLFKDRKQITTPKARQRAGSLLLQISVIQRSKANHNNVIEEGNVSVVVANISYSKIESKSQHKSPLIRTVSGCCKYQLFKDRKQITTSTAARPQRSQLLQISVIQRSKANHNQSL